MICLKGKIPSTPLAKVCINQLLTGPKAYTQLNRGADDFN